MSFLQRNWIPVLFILSLFLTACTPVEEPQTASIAGGIFFDCDKDGECADDETGIAGMCVRLYQGACGENMIQNHTTNEEGEFLFSGLAAGDYCVISDFELKTCGYDGNAPTTSISRKVTLTSGMNAELEWFGFGNLSGDSEAEETETEETETEETETEETETEAADS